MSSAPGPVIAPDLTRRRRILLPAVAAGSLLLVGWAIYLAATLPRQYDAHGWRPTWVGFDLLMALNLALTAYLGWKRRIAVAVPAAAAGTMLLLDAWFDVHLATPDDKIMALLSALIEVPSGALLLLFATQVVLRLERALAGRDLKAWGLLHRPPRRER